MERVKKVFTLIHIMLWLLLGQLVALQLKSDGLSDWRAVTAGTMLTCLYVFYGHFLLLAHYSGKKKGKTFFLKLAGIVVTSPLPLVYCHPSGLSTWGYFSDYYGMTLISAVPLFLFLSWLARVTENLVLNTIRKEQLEKQAVEAELHYLKSQINPHFLFNTLNNIHTLVYKQAPAAPEAVQCLASLMRYMIYESNARMVPLAREIDYLHDYINLQQLRYRERPVVDLRIEGDVASCHVAPLLFIHLLENAYKHSPARLEPQAIQVSVKVTADSLTFTIKNPYAKKASQVLDEPGGIGLPNVRKRLSLLYPGEHRLEVSQWGEWYTVTLTIQSHHSQPHETENHLLYYR